MVLPLLAWTPLFAIVDGGCGVGGLLWVFFGTPKKWPRVYLEGINYLLNDHADKAIELLVRTLDLDRRTFETHLALGAVFRRRGDFDRAIRLHQRLMSYPGLSVSETDRACLALAEDYLKSGILEQAENLFLKVKERSASRPLQCQALHALIEIYERERDWTAAIEASKDYALLSGTQRDIPLSHYYCELASESLDAEKTEQAHHALCKRLVSILNASAPIFCWVMCIALRRVRQGFEYYQEGVHRDPNFISEVLVPLEECYRHERNEDAYLRFLMKYQRESQELLCSP